MDTWLLTCGTKASLGQPLTTALPSSARNVATVYPEVMDPLEMVVIPKTVILFEGGFAEIFPAVCKDNQGFSDLCAAAIVNDPTEGFLEGIKKDFFLLRAEIRLKLQDDERWTVSVKRKTATCTVRLTSSSKHNDV